MTTSPDCQNFVTESLSPTTLTQNHEVSEPMDIVSDASEDVSKGDDGKEHEETAEKEFVEAVENEDENVKPVYLKALYDYEYNYDSGEKITMTTGDIYELKSKASTDWWQVKYMKDGNSFHVPACYVQVLENYDPGLTCDLSIINTQITSPNENENKDENVNQNVDENVSKSLDQQPCDNQDENSFETEDQNPSEVKSPEVLEFPEGKLCEIQYINIEKPRKLPAPVAPAVRSDYGRPTFHRTLSSGDANAPSFCVSPTTKNANLSYFGTNNISDNHIRVIVGNSEHLSPTMRVGGCSTFGKGPPSTWKSDRPKSYHCGGQSSFIPNSMDSPLSLKTVESVNDYMNLDEIRSCQKDKNEANSLENIPQKVTLTSPSSDEYQNVSIIQASIKSAPKMDNCKFIKNYSASWDMYVDNTTRHTFYYNKESGKTTWKPPRPENAPPDIPEVNVTPVIENAKEKQNKLPAGWRIDVANNGETVFIHSSSEDKWRQNVDNNGRRYYYKEGSEESCWDLPELDDVSDLESDRSGNAMVKSMTLQPQSSSKPFPQRSKTLPQMSSISIEKPGSFTPERHQSPTPSILSAVKDKAAFLNKTKVMENGKKVSKKWSQSYVKLFGSNIAFYRDQRAAAQVSGSKNGNPEMIFNLQNAKCEIAPKEWSSKKNVFMLTDNQGTQLLLQSEDQMKIKDWLQAIKLIISELNTSKDTSPQQASPHQQPYSPTSPQPYQTETVPRSPTRTTMKEKSLSPGKVFKSKSSVKRPKGKDEEEKKSIRTILTTLLKRRPDIETLVAKGIIEGTVFGSKLTDLCKKEKILVPKFVKDCITSIERRGLDQDGLYRVSGNIAEIQKLRINIDNMSTNSHYNLDDECWDIHTLTGTLKLFFRELKEPLFPFNKFEKFMEVAKCEFRMKSDERLRNYKELIYSFPKCHRETLKDLLQHLRKVISHSQQNRMQAQNIAIVFGPTLMWPEIEAPNLAITMAYQNRIVEFLLLEYENIF